jgi:hypothetical protein
MKLATPFFAVVVLAATPAAADQDFHAGTRGSVTAYELDGKTVIAQRDCARDRRGAYAYSVCGPVLRTETKKLLCAKGKGVYKWKYQVGDGPLLSQVTNCR